MSAVDSAVIYDLVIRGGTVVDGSGLASYRADVAVRDSRIASIGRIRERGREEIDAEGCVVTPGFIDGHTHMDAQVFWDPLGGFGETRGPREPRVSVNTGEVATSHRGDSYPTASPGDSSEPEADAEPPVAPRARGGAR